MKNLGHWMTDSEMKTVLEGFSLSIRAISNRLRELESMPESIQNRREIDRLLEIDSSITRIGAELETALEGSRRGGAA